MRQKITAKRWLLEGLLAITVGFLALGMIPVPAPGADQAYFLQAPAYGKVLTPPSVAGSGEAIAKDPKAGRKSTGAAGESFLANGTANSGKQPYQPGELLIRLRPGIDDKREATLHARAGAVVERRHEALGLVKVKLPPGTDLEALKAWYRRQADVELAVPNYLFQVSEVLPASQAGDGEPEMENQWHLTKIGAPDAWASHLPGAEGVVVAVVDTGIDDSHPDLDGVILVGQNFVNSDLGPMDDNGHGTHVAGIIAAVHNGIGVRGVAPNVRLLPVKVLDNEGLGTLENIIAGINYALQEGAQIINLSLGMAGGVALDHASIRAAFEPVIRLARQQGVLLVAAAGNDNSGVVSYPAALPHVVAVGATNDADQRWTEFKGGSNYGEALDLVAPGQGIYSTYPFDPYYVPMTGTSMATPMVAGVAALLWGVYSQLTSDQVETMLELAAVDLGNSGWDKQHGYGRLAALASLEVQLPPAETEPANSPAEARLLLLEEAVEGLLFPAGDEDWFRVEVGQSGLLYIEIVSPPAVDGVVEVFSAAILGNPASIPLATVDYWGSGVADVGVAELPAAGSYYLKVSEFNGRWGGAPYTLAAYMEPASDSWEPNNHQTAAPVIAEGGRVRGSLWPDGDEDWFRLQTSGRGPVRLTVTPPPPVDVVLELYNADGSLESADSRFWGASEEITFTPQAEVYYVRVVDFYSDPSYPLTSDYRLGFSRRPYLLEITTPGGLLTDLDADGRTDVVDLALAAQAYGSVAGAAGWNAWADLTSDDRVDLFDLVAVARNMKIDGIQ